MSAKKFVAICVWFLLLAPLCSAQSTNQGAIFGTVTDPSGAVVPGAKVTVTNSDTGISKEVVSSMAGQYRFPFLIPGQYRVTARAKGFQASSVAGLTLTVGQVLQTNLKMQVGMATQTVTVEATGATLNLESASRGEVISQQAIRNLPLNGREWIQLAALVPGSQSGNVKRGTYANKGVEVSFNGARDTYNTYYVDGADSTDAYHNTLISSPALDAIKEFRVETNMYSAQYGRGGGAVITAVTNSGSNSFHGSLYEYHRNKALDARPPFFTKPKSQEPGYLFNQFGGSIGGPIKKNKAFFFFSMEKFRQKTPGSLIVSFAPTALEAQGNVSQTINPWSGKPVVLTNPLTGAVIPSGILPASLISPIGKTLMDIWSQNTPNYNDPFLNLREFRGSHNAQNKYLPRIDLNLNDRNVIYGTLDWDNYDNGTVGNDIYGDKIYKEHDKTMAYTYTHTFASNLVNDLKFSYTWDLQGSTFALADQSYGVKWGFYKPFNAGLGSPRVLLYTQGYNIYTIGNSGDLYHKQRTTYLHDNLAWVKGKHTVFFGGDFRRQQFNWLANSGQSAPYFGLLDGYPNATLAKIYGETGSTFTDLLTAMPNLMTVGTGGGQLMPFSRNALSGFVQDDWRVSNRLTLNLGFRYDYEAPFSMDNNEFLGLDINTGVPRYCAAAPKDQLATMHYNYEVGGPCRDHNPDYKDFSPRIGFALRPFSNDKTVLRGGYGIFYTSENAYDTTYGGWVQPFAGQFTEYYGSFYYNPANAPGNPLFDGKSHFTTLDQKPYASDYWQGISMGYFAPTVPNYPTAYVEQYNLTLGRDVGWGTALNIGYVGSRGVNLNGFSTLANYSPVLLAKYQAANPGLANVGLRTKGFNSYYNALQATLKKEMSHGVYFLAAYNWSHALTDMSNDDTNETLFIDTTAAGNINTRRVANADFDVPQRFTFSSIWALPFGRGKKFGANWNPVVNQILGGWQADSIITIQHGVPFTVYTTSLKFPDRVCDGSLPKGQRSATHWIDYNCFVAHTPTTITNPVTGQPEVVHQQGNSAPNVIFGPGQINFDIGTEKNFNLSERFHLQFRGEFFNAFNHPNLQAPSGNYFYNTASGSAITRAASNRDIQLALRLTF
jgi:Carboxypeptidase regulatory-like domain